MKTIYLDSEFKCHLSKDGTMSEVETDFFDGKCDALIEGYRFVPAGESWIREDGAVFDGELAAPWKPWEELEEAQREYELGLLRQYEQTLQEIESALGVSE